MNIYRIEIEIYEGNGGQLQKQEGRIIRPDVVKDGICAWMYHGDGEKSYKVGETFSYPQDSGRLCPWLLDSLQSMMRTLQFGGTLPWQYKNTPYEKQIDPEGVTTEFVRCPDPTDSGIVVKVIRTKVGQAPTPPPSSDS